MKGTKRAYKRKPAIQPKDNVIMFPGVSRPSATSPELRSFAKGNGLNLNTLVHESGEVAARMVGDIIEICGEDETVVWSLVPGAVEEVAK